MKKTNKLLSTIIFLTLTFLLSACENTSIKMIKIPYQIFEMSETEITQKLYESVMGENPSEFKEKNMPVINVSWYDAIYFCNKLSALNGFEPVYSVNGETDVLAWNYTPHSGEEIEGEIEQDIFAKGYRLPTTEEWLGVAENGENYKDVHKPDSLFIYRYGPETVAKNKKNEYGLYDMSGNVMEWCWDYSRQSSICYGNWELDKKGMFSIYEGVKKINNYMSLSEGSPCVGFRIVRKYKEVPSVKMIKIPGEEFEMLQTEVTQSLYTSVMIKNPSFFKGEMYFARDLPWYYPQDDFIVWKNSKEFENNPVERVSWYDAIYFCNKLSVETGYETVYSVNGETDFTKWNYTPHQGKTIEGEIIQNISANGYRLPTTEEWYSAIVGGQDCTYAGGNELDEVAWYSENSNEKTHPVAKKKANGYGLHDMTGNVYEWCWDNDYNEVVICSGCIYNQKDDTILENGYYYRKKNNNFDQYRDLGFRIVRSVISNDSVKNANVMIKIPGQNFEMSKTEVTQGLYKSVMGENPSDFKGANNPVECVSWYDAIYFCNKLSVAKGYEPVYSVDGNTDIIKWNYTPHQGNSIEGEITQNTSANGYRLPTVEEWQYAAKGGQDYTYAGSNEIDEVAWYDKNSNDKTHPVAQKKANGYGLYDMSGNVWEWCVDSTSYGYCYYCGGSWYDNEINYEVTHIRNDDFVYDRNSDIGFRIVRSVK